MSRARLDGFISRSDIWRRVWKHGDVWIRSRESEREDPAVFEVKHVVMLTALEDPGRRVQEAQKINSDPVCY